MFPSPPAATGLGGWDTIYSSYRALPSFIEPGPPVVDPHEPLFAHPTDTTGMKEILQVVIHFAHAFGLGSTRPSTLAISMKKWLFDFLGHLSQRIIFKIQPGHQIRVIYLSFHPQWKNVIQFQDEKHLYCVTISKERVKRELINHNRKKTQSPYLRFLGGNLPVQNKSVRCALLFYFPLIHMLSARVNEVKIFAFQYC